MRATTVVELPAELLAQIDEVCPDRSRFLEEASTEHLKRMRHLARDQADIRIYNEHAERLNEEAADVLTYQVPW